MSATAVPQLWRRNPAGGIVAGVALFVVAATQLWPQWSRYHSTVVPDQIIPSGQAGTVAGLRWQVDGVRRDASAVNGGLQTVVTIGRNGSIHDSGCSGTLTDGTQQWNTDPLALATGVATTTVCALPGNLELFFRTPAEVTPTAVDIRGSDGRILVRFSL